MKKRIVKNIALATLACGFAVNANAIGNGFYLGLMMGPSTNNAPSLRALKKLDAPVPPPSPDIYTIADPRIQQFASRFFIGNKFNTYAGVEGGVTFISSIKYDSHGVPTQGTTDQRIRDLDLVIKGIFPLGNVFDIYGKIGVAYSYITSGGSFNPSFKLQDPLDPNSGKYTTSNQYKQKFSPTYSIGASYDINQSWVTDLSYNTVQVGNNIGSVTFFALAISYHFTDKYCGQFLCDD